MPQTVADLGKLVKAKYPQYESIPDADLGRKVKAKYPQYNQFVDAPPESPVQSVMHDASIGWREGVSHLAHTAGNAASLVGAKDTAKKLTDYAKTEAPPASETAGRDSVVSQVAQGIGGAVPQVAEYAPAMVVGKKWAPVIAGLIGAVGASDKGKKAALTEGAKSAIGFWAMGRSARLPTRGGRAASAAMIGGTAAALEGGDPKQIAAGAITGGAFGAIGKGHAETAAEAHPVMRSITRALNPRALAPEANKTGQALRSNLGEMRRSGLIAERALRGARDAFDKVPLEPDNPGGISTPALDFIHAIQTGDFKAIPQELHSFGKTISKLYDDRWKQLNERGLLNAYVEHYFSQIWQKPDQARELYRIMSKRPLQGSERFTNKRVFANVREGIEYAKAHPESGMQLVSNNPIDVVLLGLREQDKLIMAHDFLQGMKQQGLISYAPPGEHGPVNWLELTDAAESIFRRMANEESAKGGKYFMPPDAAALVNNYLSPGLRNNEIYRGFMTLGNTLNKFQLGASAFHLAMTSLEGAISQVSLGIKYGVEAGLQKRADLAVAGLRAIAHAPFVPFEPAANFALREFQRKDAWTRTGKLMQEYAKPGSHPEFSYLARSLARAGGAVDQDPIYRAGETRAVKRAIAGSKQELNMAWNEREKLFTLNPKHASELYGRMKKLGQMSGIVHGLFGIPGATMETAMHWLFEYSVPQQKVGAFLRMADFEIARLGPDVPEAEREAALQKSWDSVDNRFGQMVYDNKFWNRTAKDLMHVMLRSVGWRAGTFEEFGGAINDWKKFIEKKASGERVDFTHKMAWSIALPVVMGSVGGMLTYLSTGERPQGLMDLFHPRTGQKDEGGRDKRMDLASYMNDVQKVLPVEGESYPRRIGRYVKGALNPGLTSTIDLLQNMDWKRHEIMDRDGEPIDKLTDLGKYALREIIPFAFEDALPESIAPVKTQYKGTTGPVTGTTFAQLLAKLPAWAPREVGITPAPADLMQRPWERYAYEHGEMGRTAGGVSRTAALKSQVKSDMLKSLRFGDEREFKRLFKVSQDRGLYTENDEQKIRNAANVPSSIDKFKALTLANKLTAYRYALADKDVKPEERAALRHLLFNALAKGYAKILRRPADDRERIRVTTQLKVLGMLDENGDFKESADDEE